MLINERSFLGYPPSPRDNQSLFIAFLSVATYLPGKSYPRSFILSALAWVTERARDNHVFVARVGATRRLNNSQNVEAPKSERTVSGELRFSRVKLTAYHQRCLRFCQSGSAVATYGAKMSFLAR